MTYELMMTLDELDRTATEAWVIDDDVAGEHLYSYTYLDDTDWVASLVSSYAGVPEYTSTDTYDCP